MESFFSRYKNALVLMGVLFVQVIILASNVERDNPRAASHGRTSLVRVWTINTISPVERGLVSTGHFFRDTWRNYVDLHDVRRQNSQLQSEVDRLRLEQARWKEDISESQRLKQLLDFKERFVGHTLAAQVIGTTGSEQSRVVTIDKGAQAGLKSDMAVITPDGIVGKVKEVYKYSSHVLLITDHESGAGIILEKSRLHGVLNGTGPVNLVVNHIMADEKVEPGEHVITSGGDGIFPRGLPVGAVISSAPDPNPDNAAFLIIRIKPAADFSRLEEVLVVTEMAEQSPDVADNSARVRAADILSERLPSVPKGKTETADETEKNKSVTGGTKVAAGPGSSPATTSAATTKPKPRPPVLKGSTPVNALTSGKPVTPLGGPPAVKTSGQKKKAGLDTPVKKAPVPSDTKPPTEAPPQ